MNRGGGDPEETRLPPGCPLSLEHRPLLSPRSMFHSVILAAVSVPRSPTTISLSSFGLAGAMDGSRPLSTLVRSFLGSPFYSPHQQAHSCCGWLGYLNPWASRQAFRGPKQPRTSQFAADFGRDRFAFFFSLRAPVSLRICRRLSTLF